MTPVKTHAHEAQVLSYFSRPTDLAADLRGWSAFRGGTGYAVDLREGADWVRMRRLVDEDEDTAYLVLIGDGDPVFFERVLQAVAHALSHDSDHVGVERALSPHVRTRWLAHLLAHDAPAT